MWWIYIWIIVIIIGCSWYLIICIWYPCTWTVKATRSSYVLNAFGWRTGKFSLTGEVLRSWRWSPMLSQVSRKSAAVVIIQHLKLSPPLPSQPRPHRPFLHSISFIYLFREHLVSWRLNFIDWPSVHLICTDQRKTVNWLFSSSSLLYLFTNSLSSVFVFSCKEIDVYKGFHPLQPCYEVLFVLLP